MQKLLGFPTVDHDQTAQKYIVISHLWSLTLYHTILIFNHPV